MAVAIAFTESNAVLSPTESGVGYVLPVNAGSVEEGLPAFISCWKLTPEEIQEIAETGRVWLWVLGGHPPVCIEGQNPFKLSGESA